MSDKICRWKVEGEAVPARGAWSEAIDLFDAHRRYHAAHRADELDRSALAEPAFHARVFC